MALPHRPHPPSLHPDDFLKALSGVVEHELCICPADSYLGNSGSNTDHFLQELKSKYPNYMCNRAANLLRFSPARTTRFWGILYLRRLVSPGRWSIVDRISSLTLLHVKEILLYSFNAEKDNEINRVIMRTIIQLAWPDIPATLREWLGQEDDSESDDSESDDSESDGSESNGSESNGAEGTSLSDRFTAVAIHLLSGEIERNRDVVCTAEERKSALKICYDLAKQCQVEHFRYYEKLLPYFISGCTDIDPETRKIAAGGIRIGPKFVGSLSKPKTKGFCSSLEDLLKDLNMRNRENVPVFDAAASLYKEICHLLELGTIALGLKTKEGVVLAVEKHVASLLERSIEGKLIQIDDHIGCAMSGLIADGCKLVKHARVETQNHRISSGKPMTVESTAHAVALRFSEESMSRRFEASLLIAGHDENGPSLYYRDPSGTFLQCNAKAIGSGSEGADSSLQEQYNEEITLKEAETIALSIMRQVLEVRVTPDNVGIANVAPIYHLYTLSEVEDVTSRFQTTLLSL